MFLDTFKGDSRASELSKISLRGVSREFKAVSKMF